MYPIIYSNALCIRVVDGDTFYFRVPIPVPVPAKVKLEMEEFKVRLAGVNTPEIRGKEKEEGLKAKEYVKNLILNKECKLTVLKKGKYGRYIAKVNYKGTDLSEVLLLKKLAEKYRG